MRERSFVEIKRDLMYSGKLASLETLESTNTLLLNFHTISRYPYVSPTEVSHSQNHALIDHSKYLQNIRNMSRQWKDTVWS